MNVAKYPMTATLMLPAKILLDHTIVLVTLDLKETERQVANRFQARTSKIALKINWQTRVYCHAFYT